MGVGGRGDHGPCVSLRDASLGAGPQYLLDTNSKLRKQLRTEQGVDERHSAAHAALAPHTAPDALFVPFGSNFPHARPSRVWELTLRALSTASAVLGDHLEVGSVVHPTQRTRNGP